MTTPSSSEIERLRAENERLAGLLHANGKPRFNEAMRRAESAEARAASAEAEATSAKNAQAQIEAQRDALAAKLGVMDAALEEIGRDPNSLAVPGIIRRAREARTRPHGANDG